MISQLNQPLDQTEENHLGLVSSHSSEHVRSAARFLTRLYVPLVTIVLVLAVGNWLAKRSEFDPLTVAQNSRIRFQTGAEENARLDGLTPAEAKAASKVVRDGFKEGSGSNELLYLGNSQTMAITDEKPGDLTTPQWLQILLLRRDGAGSAPQVILGSLPNQSMAEFLITLVAASQWRHYPIHLVIGSITLREWRGLSVRDSVRPWAEAAPVHDALTSLIAESPDLQLADAAIEGSIKSEKTGDGVAAQAQSQTVATRFEQRVQKAASRIPLFKMRTYLYEDIHVSYMGLRNWMFGIHTDTPRPIPEPTYRASLQLLELSMRYARSRSLNLILYLAPVRPIQPNPTLPADLVRFRRDAMGLCEKYAVTCNDYSDLVPEKLWADYSIQGVAGEGGERDYAHFTGPAHKLVARRLMADIGPRLETVR